MARINGTTTMQGGEYRPCLVYGRKALFHRWVKKEGVILQCKELISTYKRARIYEEFEKTKVITNDFTPVIVGRTYAIVEYEDGSVAIVVPEEIRFLDRWVFRE